MIILQTNEKVPNTNYQWIFRQGSGGTYISAYGLVYKDIKPNLGTLAYATNIIQGKMND